MTDLIHPDHVRKITQIAARAEDTPLQRRARILMLYHAGKPTAEIAREVGLSANSVLHWRRQYRAKGMGIFPEETAGPSAAPAAKPRPARKPRKKAAPAGARKKPAALALPETRPPAKKKKKSTPDLAETVARIMDAVEDFIGDKKRIEKLRGITKAKPFKKFVAELEAQRKALKKQLKKKDLKKKAAKTLRQQLQILEKQIQKAEKVLKKMEQS